MSHIKQTNEALCKIKPNTFKQKHKVWKHTTKCTGNENSQISTQIYLLVYVLHFGHMESSKLLDSHLSDAQV